jgi:hypothetical protein
MARTTPGRIAPARRPSALAPVRLGSVRLGSVLGALAWLLACRGDAPERPTSEGDAADRSHDERAREHGEASARASAAVEREPYTPASTLGEPVEIRVATRTRPVYAAPDPKAPARGRIPSKDNFYVYERQAAPGCKQPWAKVADAGWVCLERTSASETTPRPLPELLGDGLLPFIYARHKRHKDRSTPALPVYASLAAFNRGDAPIDTLAAYGSYAFVRAMSNRGRRVYVTSSRRVVPAAELEEFKPSEFSGRLLDEGPPILTGMSLAWAVRWKTLIRAEPNPSAAVVARVPYHATLYVTGAGVDGPDGERWFEVAEHPDNPGVGWISDHDIRRFLPVPPPAPILAGQITVDVDLDEQVLSVWREQVPVFVTLISSGKPGDATPRGIYRIETKWAYGKMASLASAPDPYYVDAVPWAMYFDGRYALHAAYWHDLFGHRMSHGCVNLAPRDAKLVFELVTPALPDGWLLVHEHGADPGAVVRIRSGDKPVPDRRKPLDPAQPSSP